MKIKKDYQNKRFVNPYFQKQEKKPFKFDTFFCLKVLTAVILFYVLFYSNLLKIEKIQVSGLDTIVEAQFMATVNDHLDGWRWYLFPRRQMLFFSREQLAAVINNVYPLNKLEISRDWRGLKINLEEKISQILIYNKKNFYLANGEGKIIADMAPDRAGEEMKRLPIFNVEKETLSVGEEIISQKLADFLLRLNESARAAKFDISGYESRGEDEATLVAKEGWRAYFDLDSDINRQLENLLLVLKEKIKGQSANIQYVDLRFGDQVYYK